MRSKKELYEIILDEYKKFDYQCHYICHFIRDMWGMDILTDDEYEFIMNDFESNKPSYNIHEEFYNNRLYIGNRSTAWWITGLSESNKVRIAFLEKMVRIQDAII